jgi:hypothetical protein
MIFLFLRDFPFVGLDRYLNEVLDSRLMNVPIGGGFTSGPLSLPSGGTLMDPYLDPWIWSRKKSFEIWFQHILSIREVIWLLEEMDMDRAYHSLVSSDSGSAVDMVKNWTEEDYVL